MKQNSLLFLTFFFAHVQVFVSCSKDEKAPSIAPGLIEDLTFESTVLVDGHEFDNTIIKNCTFENIEGDGLQIRDVNNLCIENCIFKNISENAIRFRNSGVSDGVKILNNEIFNIKENGILAPEGHINTTIKGNIIRNIATSNVSSQFGAPHHGIYFQGFNVLITENTIYNVINDQGNCVSIRTYGTISRNTLYNATDHGISYFSDHPANKGNLLIENNMIYDNGKRGVNLSSNGNETNLIGSANVRFNTIISKDKSPVGFGNDLESVNILLAANILVRTDGGSTFVFEGSPYISDQNLTSSANVDFVNFAERDLHILSTSTAVNFVSSITGFPNVDFDGEGRPSADLDAGADEL